MAFRANKTKIVASETANVTLVAAQTDSIHLLNVATGAIVTLPAATALNTGVSYKFVAKTSVTSNNYTIQGATSSDLFYGGVAVVSSTADNSVSAAPNGSSHYKLVMAGTTTGGLVGTTVIVTCIGLNAWLIEGILLGSGDVTATGIFA